MNERSLDAHKYSHGTVAVIAGSDQYPGAAVLTVGGARRGGAGYIQYLDLNERPTDLVLQTYPDVIKRAQKKYRPMTVLDLLNELPKVIS